MSAARVAVTGLGCVSALGQGAAATWAKLAAGQGGIRPVLRGFRDDPRYTVDGPAAAIEGLDGAALEAYAGKRVLLQMDPVAAFAAVATHEALLDAGLLETPGQLADASVIYGSASGGNLTIEEAYGRIFLKGA